MKKKCTLCETTHYQSVAFKGGRVCEDCLKVFKPESQPDSTVCHKD